MRMLCTMRVYVEYHGHLGHAYVVYDEHVVKIRLGSLGCIDRINDIILFRCYISKKHDLALGYLYILNDITVIKFIY